MFLQSGAKMEEMASEILDFQTFPEGHVNTSPPQPLLPGSD